jgi:hypothetical protein
MAQDAAWRLRKKIVRDQAPCLKYVIISSEKVFVRKV